MTTPTCTRCGTPMIADASFCGQCGTPLVGSEVPPLPPPPPSSVAQTIPSRIPARGRGFPIWPLIMLVVGVLAVAAALLLVPRREPPAGESLLGSGRPTPTPAAKSGVPPPSAPALDALSAGAIPTSGASGGLPEPPPWPAAVPTEPPPPTPTPTPRLVAVFKTRQAARFDVSPEDADIAIDGRSIGTADDWDDKGGGKLYEFGGPGNHYVKLSLKGYRTVWIKIVVSPDASEKVAEVDTELKKHRDKGDDSADQKDKKSKKSKEDKDEKDDDEGT